VASKSVFFFADLQILGRVFSPPWDRLAAQQSPPLLAQNALWCSVLLTQKGSPILNELCSVSYCPLHLHVQPNGASIMFSMSASARRS
jgi:hypothetical protein